MYEITAVIVIILILVYYLHSKTQNSPPTLYDRLGGVYAIAAVVNHFSDALIQNPIVGRDSKNPYLRDWHRNKLNRLPGLKFMRTLWLCSLAGGPFKYTATRPGKCPFSLENAHKNLYISSDEFNEVAAELNRSLTQFNVPPKEKSDVLQAFMNHKAEVIGSSFKC